jgi:hypothetical protein
MADHDDSPLAPGLEVCVSWQWLTTINFPAFSPFLACIRHADGPIYPPAPSTTIPVQLANATASTCLSRNRPIAYEPLHFMAT